MRHASSVALLLQPVHLREELELLIGKWFDSGNNCGVATLQLWNSPVIERELRIVSRKWETYWGRTAAASMALLVAWLFFLGVLTFGSVPAVGRVTFGFLAIGSAFALSTTLLKTTAAAFVREKVGDTLGLLLLTPLRPREILLGKLGATSLPAIYQYVAMLPVLGLPILAEG